MPVGLLAVGGKEVGEARTHVAGEVLDQDGDRVRFRIERDEEVVVLQLCERAFRHALVATKLTADFVEEVRGDGIHDVIISFWTGMTLHVGFDSVLRECCGSPSLPACPCWRMEARKESGSRPFRDGDG